MLEHKGSPLSGTRRGHSCHTAAHEYSEGFQSLVLTIKVPDTNVSIPWLGLQSRYEKFHKFQISDTNLGLDITSFGQGLDK